MAAFLLFQTALSAQVYSWQGHSPLWSDLSNWQKDGEQASGLPSATDHVVFSATAGLTEVVIDVPAEAASLTVADDRPFVFSGKDGGTLTVSGSLALNGSALIRSSLDISLTAPGGSGAVLACTESHLAQISFSEKAYQKTAPIGTAGRASCAFFTIVPEVTSPTCNGDSDGIASVEEPADGVGPFSYQWVSGPATREWIGVGAGTYTVIVIDLGQGGLPCSEDIFVNEPGPLALFSMNGTPPVCAGDCNGSAAPIVIGGNGGYLLEWSSGETGFTPSALCASFTLDVTDQEGCEFTTDFTFPDAPEPVTVTGDVSDVVCAGDDNGAVNAQITGGDGSYALAWTGPGGFSAVTEEISDLVPGTYVLTATDGEGCEGSASFSVNEFPPIAIAASATDNVCPGGASGALDLNVSGGSAPYSYAWSGPDGFSAATEDISELISGTYSLVLTDENGCIFTDTYQVDEPDALSLTGDVTPVLCFGADDGMIEAEAAGGTPPYGYSWAGPDGFSAPGALITGLMPGTYSLTVTDGNGCEANTDFEVTGETEIEIVLSETAVTCQGGNDGAVSATVTGGAIPYTFAWTGPGGFASADQNIEDLLPGTYDLVLTDANGCQSNAQAEITDALPIVISGTVTNTACATGNTGAVSTEITGGVSPFVFAWTGPGGYTSADQNISGLAPGIYNLTVTDDAGCDAAASFTVDAPDALTADFDIEPVACFGGSSGSINTTASGGTAPYNYFWIGPGGFSSDQPDISGLAAGTYTLLLSDVNGCSGFAEAVVAQNSDVNIIRTITQVTCFGGSNGAINITASGGTPGYAYSWEGSEGFTSTSEDLSGIPAGTYTITVTDANGCEGTRTYNVNQPAEITLSGTVVNVECAGDSDGAVSITVASGAGPFTYGWTGPGGFVTATQNITGVPAGTYTATATNSAGCSGSADFTVDEAPAIVLTATSEGITCFGDDDGSLELNIEGGQAPFTIDWTGPGGFTSDALLLENLAAGAYTVLVTDDFGCAVEETFIVSGPEVFELDITAENISCFGVTDGTVQAAVTGGTAPYTYAWTGPDGFTSEASAADSLSAGEYVLLVTDAVGCTLSGSATVTAPQLLTVTLDVQQPECLNDNGILTAVTEGGTAADDYTYLWVNGGGNTVGTGTSISNLSPGNYTVTVTDDNGCQASQGIQLLREGINLTASVANVQCAGDENGVINVNPVSGTAPFTFTWIGPDGFSSDQQFLADLAPGTYNLQVADVTGCILNESYDIAEPDSVIFDPEVTPETCPDAANGAVTLNVSGGMPGYLYAWTGPDGFSSAAASVSGLEAGIYNVTATDVNGCEAAAEIELPVAEAAEFTFDATDPTCFGESTGEITAVLNGTVGDLTYAWEGPEGFTASAEMLTGVDAGTYTLTVTDDAGCEVAGSVELTDPEAITADLTVFDATCLEANGGATVIPEGGTGALEVEWSAGDGTSLASGNDLTDVFAGLYEVTVSDDAGCSLTLPVTISDADGTVIGDVTDASCSDAADGAVSVTVEDGAPPFTYVWTGPDGFSADIADISGLAAGVYSPAVTDSNGCVYAADFEVGAPAPLSASAEVSSVTCAENDGAVTLTPAGGTAPYEINWIGPDGFTAAGELVENLIAGTYSYEIIDGQGCSATGETEVPFIPDIEALAVIQEILCGGTDDGALDISLSGGTAPYTAAWSGPEGFTSSAISISDLAPGEYFLTVTDATGCEAEFSYTLDAPDAIAIDLTAEAPDCGETDGSLTAVITGGTADTDYFISWTDQSGNTLGGANPLENLGPGSYTLSVSDDNGCSASENEVLMNPGIDFELELTPISCADFADGAAVLTVTADNPPYTTEWIAPGGFTATGDAIADLTAGTYSFQITAADGCTASGAAELVNPAALDFSAVTADACFGAQNGSILLTPVNAVPETDIAWTGPDGFTSSGQLIEDLAPGAYNFDLTDGNGCVLSDVVEVEEGSEIIAEVTSTDLSCAEVADGSISLTSISGGSEPYAVLWTGPDGLSSADSILTGLNPGGYMLTVTDALGCTSENEVNVTAPDTLGAEVEVTYPECDDPEGNTGVALTPQGGTGPYDIVWTGDEFISDQFSIEELEPGNYNYVLTDANGCTLEGTVDAEAFIPLSADVLINDISCAGAGDGSIEVSPIGGVGEVSVNWSGPDEFESGQNLIEGLQAGTYSLLLLDEEGCAFQAGYTVEAPEILTVEVSEITDANCNVATDGVATGAAAGGTPPYSFTWEGDEGFSAEGPSAEGLAPGLYTLSVTDANGCTETTQAEIDFIFEISADAGEDILVCASELPLLLVGDGDGASEFLWTDASGDTLIADALLDFSAASGSYVLFFTAGNGVCTAADSLTVEVVSGPEADAGEDTDVFAEEIFTLGGSPVSETGTAFSWSPLAGGDFNPAVPNPSGFILESTVFTVTVTDDDGCVASDSVTVRLIPGVEISSGFTPNNDGVNDRWIIDNIELFPESLVSVFNRWGQLLYRQRSYNSGNAWDGTYEGNALPIGTYYYTIELNDPRFPDPFTGPITIYR